MRLHATLPLVLLAAVAAEDVTAQPVNLTPRDMLVVTTDGLHWMPKIGGFATLLADEAAFGGLSSPALEWVPGTDSVLVVSGPQLMLATVLGSPPTGATVNFLTPNVGGNPLYHDLDIHPGTGELWLLDRGNGQLHRFDAPYVPGMVPAQSVAVPKTTRGMCIDPKAWPRRLVIAGNDGVSFVNPATGAITPRSLLTFSTGVECEQDLVNHPMAVKPGNDNISQCVSLNLVTEINISGFCKPANKPVDLDWSPTNRRLYVLAEDGINSCAGAYTGGNHIVRFQVPGGGPNPPVIMTSTAGSGITGAAGDLTLVQDDFAHAYRYGDDCVASNGVPTLDHGPGIGGSPNLGNQNFTLQVDDAPVHAPVWMIFGFFEAEIPLGNCAALLNPVYALTLPNTDASGALDLVAPVPNLPTLAGADVLLQALLTESNGLPVTTNGLKLHLGL